jgi:hypothetical protein
MTKIQRFQNAEVLIPYLSTASRFYFPDIPNLRFVSLLNLEVYTSSVYGPQSVLSGLPVVDTAWIDVFVNSYLVLYYNDKESCNRIPLSEFQDFINTTPTYNFLRATFAGQQVVWSKSYIIFPRAIDWNNVTATSDFVFPFGVYYA